MGQTHNGEVGPASSLADGVVIDIWIGPEPDMVLVRHRKPDLTRVLEGRSVSDALSLIPLLLPVCGRAQSIAAERAIEAVRQIAPDRRTESERAVSLLIEQALSHAWRLTMDWPILLGSERDLASLKKVRDAAASARMDDDLPAALGGLAVTLDSLTLELSAERAGDTGQDDVTVLLGQGKNIASQIYQRAKAIQQRLARRGNAEMESFNHGRPLEKLAMRALQTNPFDSSNPTLDTPVNMLPNAGFVAEQFGLVSQYLAMILSLQDTVRSLRRWPETDLATLGGSKVDQVGIGSAMTARGPVFHAIGLDGEKVTQWRILAPTDWHFAPDGAAAVALRNAGLAATEEAVARFIISGFDPCARYTLRLDRSDA